MKTRVLILIKCTKENDTREEKLDCDQVWLRKWMVLVYKFFKNLYTKADKMNKTRGRLLIPTAYQSVCIYLDGTFLLASLTLFLQDFKRGRNMEKEKVFLSCQIILSFIYLRRAERRDMREK